MNYDFKKNVNLNLAVDEIKMFGAYNKQPKGYQKMDLLGKGGCAVVWLCIDLKTNEQVAIKQFPKCAQNQINYKSGLLELEFNR